LITKIILVIQIVEFICHTENRKSAILISDTTLPKEEVDEIKEKLWP